ncbi:MAG: OFA family MFS transporter [Gemmatimonadales bacterium]|jgi:MFS family permease|nr:OFA family MFS transporter [Gemmatimonadales bacterium]
MAGLLSRERTVAGPGFNRWLVPPAALAIHLSIGMAYGLSVFWLPLSKAIGITESAPGDWKVSTVGWTFTLAIFWLGASAALFGAWLEREGPRKAGVAAAFCWAGGFVIAALGVRTHQLWLLLLGLGVVGGIGLGLGYISPVSTLIKWFPDRRGLATGLAIMGFGGGAMIGAPLADRLLKHYAGPTTVGVWQTFLTLGAIYFVAMLAGAFGYRVPPRDWKPAGWSPPAQARKAMVAQGHVHVSRAWRLPQFWLLWGVLCMNVSAGIGVLGMASPMIQEIFGGRLIGTTGALADLSTAQKAEVASIAAGFTGLLSLANIIGRLFWASLSDVIGRQRTYLIFFAVGAVLYALVPLAGRLGNVALFVGLFFIILTMYGGGFATIPAYLADIFGTQFVGAIHGRLLTAWSTAGILGPILVNYLREFQIGRGLPPAQAYNVTMYILAGMLVVGFVCNLAMRPLAEEHFMSESELGASGAAGGK